MLVGRHLEIFPLAGTNLLLNRSGCTSAPARKITTPLRRLRMLKRKKLFKRIEEKETTSEDCGRKSVHQSFFFLTLR